MENVNTYLKNVIVVNFSQNVKKLDYQYSSCISCISLFLV